MSGIATAIVGGAVIGGIASNKAASKAADAQNAATAANAYQGEIATDQYEDYKSTYRPLEQKMVQEAENYDNEANQQKAAADAQSTVSTQLGLAQDRLRRTPGLDPSSAAATAANTNLALKGAAMGANAQNAARKQVQDTAYARQLDMAGIGKGLVTGASTGLASAAATAQAAANAQNATAAQTASGVGSAASSAIKALTNVNWGLGNSVYTGSSWADGYTPNTTSPITVDSSVTAMPTFISA